MAPCLESSIRLVRCSLRHLSEKRCNFTERFSKRTEPRNTQFSTMEKPQIIIHAEKSLNFTPFDVRWIPCSCRCAVLGTTPRSTGVIKVFSLEDGQFQLTNEFEKPKAFKCCSFGAATHEERHLATGNFDGQLQIWDLENTQLPVYEAKAHKEIINCLDGVGGGISTNCGAPEIVTGSKDGSVKVWDTRQKDTPVACMQPDIGQQHRDCWTVAFGNSYNDEERCVCAGYDNGDLKLFDLRAMAIKWETNLKNGVCCVEFDRKTIQMNKMVVTTLESMFHVFNMRTNTGKADFASIHQKAHKSTVWFVRHLPQNRDIFMTGGGNGSVHLWKYNYGENRSNQKNSDKGIGHITNCQQLDVTTQPIPAFDWNSDFQGLSVCTSFDQMLRALIVTKLKTL